MNKYDNFFEFKLAKVSDVDSIMKFIKKYWDNNHILANDKEFFLWQYGCGEYNDYDSINMVIMRDLSGEIVGMNGFVKYSDNNLNMFVSSAMTKVKEELSLPLCGVELIKRFKELVPAKAYYSSGTNPRTMLPIGKRIFHYDIGMVQQYYMYNDQIKDYNVLEMIDEYDISFEKTSYSFEIISNIEELVSKFNIEKQYSGQAYKSREYIGKRFFDHPIYRYIAFGIKASNVQDCFEAVMFAREIEVNGVRVLRIVDYLGELDVLGKIGQALHNLMYRNEYEYIDLMVAKLPVELMKKSGFHLRTSDDNNIVPTYFEPFVRQNIDIYYQRSDENIVIFKADGDQDRPNKR